LKQLILRKLRISAILSDYDGTLCPTTSNRKHRNGSGRFSNSGKIPEDLEKTLLKVSKRIPICIISSKDFSFLHETIGRFTNVLSCILGIETVIHKVHNDTNHNDLDCIIIRSLALTLENQVLRKNSAILKGMIEKVSSIERMSLSKGSLLLKASWLH
jgi:trehalose-6-phosphatase